jgi:hypothetical protein
MRSSMSKLYFRSYQVRMRNLRWRCKNKKVLSSNSSSLFISKANSNRWWAHRASSSLIIRLWPLLIHLQGEDKYLVWWGRLTEKSLKNRLKQSTNNSLTRSPRKIIVSMTLRYYLMMQSSTHLNKCIIGSKLFLTLLIFSNKKNNTRTRLNLVMIRP